MPKQYLILIISFIISSCLKNHKETDNNNKFIDVKENVSSSTITYYDNDSIYNTSFKSKSVYNGTQLKWDIDIYQGNILEKTIKDSTNGLSYLVKALDINKDNKGDLAFVTGEFKYAYNNISTLRCSVFIYTKINNSWTRLSIPELNKNQLAEYYGGDLIEVKHNCIVRKYSIHDSVSNKTNKNRVITYGVNNINQVVVINDRIEKDITNK